MSKKYGVKRHRLLQHRYHDSFSHHHGPVNDRLGSLSCIRIFRITTYIQKNEGALANFPVAGRCARGRLSPRRNRCPIGIITCNGYLVGIITLKY